MTNPNTKQIAGHRRFVLRWDLSFVPVWFALVVIANHVHGQCLNMQSPAMKYLEKTALHKQPAGISLIAVQKTKTAPPPSCFLPRFSTADLPVFCRIEHKIAIKAPVAFKFRLGSVDYVDWLEGKQRFGTFMP